MLWCNAAFLGEHMAELRRSARGSFFRALAGFFKLVILIIPWLFVAHGVVVLQAHYAFFNNSVETTAHVVAHEASSAPISADTRQTLIEQPVVDIAPRPAFVYTHENGQIFVGAPVARPYLWKDVFGTSHRAVPSLLSKPSSASWVFPVLVGASRFCRWGCGCISGSGGCTLRAAA